MKLIPLTQGKFAQVDDEDFEWLNQYKWHVKHTGNNWYATTCSKGDERLLKIGKSNVDMHRLIMGCVMGDGKEVDHRDLNGLNCQKNNLRFCTKSENNKNKRASGASKYLGVCKFTRRTPHFNKSSNSIKIYVSVKYMARLIHQGKRRIHLGIFDDENHAAYAYNEGAIKYHGEFARLNILPDGYVPPPSRLMIDEIISYISKFTKENKRFPLYREIMNEFGLTMKQVFNRMQNLKVLEYKSTLPPELFKK